MMLSANFLLLLCTVLQVANGSPDRLARKYHEGEKILYHMKATNRGGLNSVSYEVLAEGEVKRTARSFLKRSRGAT